MNHATRFCTSDDDESEQTSDEPPEPPPPSPSASTHTSSAWTVDALKRPIVAVSSVHHETPSASDLETEPAHAYGASTGTSGAWKRSCSSSTSHAYQWSSLHLDGIIAPPPPPPPPPPWPPPWAPPWSSSRWAASVASVSSM